MQKQVIPSGSLEARFDPASGDLISLSGTGTQETIIEEKNVAHAVTTVHLSRVAETAAPQQELTELRHVAGYLVDSGSRLTLYTKPSQQEMQQNIQRTQLGHETLDSLLQQLNAVETSGTKSDQTQLYLNFKALVYLHPESCARGERGCARSYIHDSGPRTGFDWKSASASRTRCCHQGPPRRSRSCLKLDSDTG
jgi:hypothetical protein